MAKQGRPATGRKDRYAGKHVTFTDNSDDVVRELRKLSGRALRAGGRVAAKAIQEATPKRSGKLREAVGYRVKNRRDGTPYLELGFYSKSVAKKKGRAYFANPTWFEFGTKPHMIKSGTRRGSKTGKKALANPAILFGKTVRHPGTMRPFIKTAVMGSINDLRKAQEQGLAQLNKRIEELAGIPDDYEVEGGESP